MHVGGKKNTEIINAKINKKNICVLELTIKLPVLSFNEKHYSFPYEEMNIKNDC